MRTVIVNDRCPECATFTLVPVRTCPLCATPMEGWETAAKTLAQVGDWEKLMDMTPIFMLQLSDEEDSTHDTEFAALYGDKPTRVNLFALACGVRP